MPLTVSGREVTNNKKYYVAGDMSVVSRGAIISGSSAQNTSCVTDIHVLQCVSVTL